MNCTVVHRLVLFLSLLGVFLRVRRFCKFDVIALDVSFNVCSQQYLDPDGLLQQYNDAESVTINDGYLLSCFWNYR